MTAFERKHGRSNFAQHRENGLAHEVFHGLYLSALGLSEHDFFQSVTPAGRLYSAFKARHPRGRSSGPRRRVGAVAAQLAAELLRSAPRRAAALTPDTRPQSRVAAAPSQRRTALHCATLHHDGAAERTRRGPQAATLFFIMAFYDAKLCAFLTIATKPVQPLQSIQDFARLGVQPCVRNHANTINYLKARAPAWPATFAAGRGDMRRQPLPHAAAARGFTPDPQLRRSALQAAYPQYTPTIYPLMTDALNAVLNGTCAGAFGVDLDLCAHGRPRWAGGGGGGGAPPPPPPPPPPPSHTLTSCALAASPPPAGCTRWDRRTTRACTAAWSLWAHAWAKTTCTRSASACWAPA